MECLAANLQNPQNMAINAAVTQALIKEIVIEEKARTEGKKSFM